VEQIGTFFIGLIVIAVVFVLVNPASSGVQFIEAVGSAIAEILRGAAGTATGTGAPVTTTASTGTGG
jgi:hypothetical protein